MTNGQDGSNKAQTGRAAYRLNLKAKTGSSTSCSFCWFVLALYPTLTGMPDSDTSTYAAHLKRSHGLKAEIEA